MSDDTQPATTPTDIRALDDATVARIAAGEVVERPASAVKELVENSLDADPTRIDVTIEAGGTELIRVTDDGRGMTEADVRAAVREHTTSKIDRLDDLESGLSTLGFRGEALYTIGSVSRLTIRTKPRSDSGPDAGDVARGTELRLEGGEVTSVEPVGCPAGTTVEVADLFYNTPARRKFLKSTATEFAHVNRFVTRYALANPDVAVSLTHDGRQVFATTGQGDLKAAVLAVYGREVAASMIEVTADTTLPSGPLESVTGLVSHPETTRSSREYLATFVNGRAVRSPAVREGIMRAYGTQLGGDRYPFVVLSLSIPSDSIDVNVHPRKQEIRFDDAEAVRRQVESAVESTLLDHGLIRSGAPRGKSAPGEATITPAGEADADPETPTASGGTDQSPSTTSDAGVRSSTDPGEDTGGRTGGRGPEPAAVNSGETISESTPEGAETRSSTSGSASESAAESASEIPVDSGLETATDSSSAHCSGVTDPGNPAPSAPPSGDSSSEFTSSASDRAAPLQKSTASTDREMIESGDRNRFQAPTEQRTLTGDTANPAREYDRLPSLRVLGQFRDTYVVCETVSGLLLIDQHAADERVNYERLTAAFAADDTAQALATHVTLELTAAEAATFDHYRDALASLGFSATKVDDRSVRVESVPAVLNEVLDPSHVRDVLSSFVADGVTGGAESVDDHADVFLADLACYPSITGNTSLTDGSVAELLEALDDCENPYACPHGRPVIVSIDDDEIDDRFERDYPGHAGH